MQIINNVQEMRNWRTQATGQIGLVPTMGALHSGHLELIKKTQALCDKVIVSIFVNPKQFGPNEDFEKYPRTLSKDISLLKELNVDVVFTPNPNEIYSNDANDIIVDSGQIGRKYCGYFRPGHFNGVLTIVLKLFNLTTPNLATFGKKDFQQLWLIKKMVENFDINIEIIGIETIREGTGLAKSSRNSYLTAEDQTKASKIFHVLLKAQKAWHSGEKNANKLKDMIINELDSNEFKIEFVEICDQLKLLPIQITTTPSVILLALKFKSVRLIDNMELI